jgi:hypothetical protein
MNKPTTYSSKNILLPILMFVLLLIEMEIIDNLFPYPGFKAIIALPMIYGICLVVIIIGIFLTKKLNFKSQIAIWFIVFIVNSLIAVQLYPQQSGPTVLKQIGYTYNVIKNYKTITKEDLELYIENEYDPFDKSVPDDKERYVAALYKFRNEINRDGSNFLYGQKDKPITDSTNIRKHLQNGKDTLIWGILETFKTDT